MDSSLKIDIMLDMLVVRHFIIQPDIWDRFAEPGLDPDKFFPVYDAYTSWLSVHSNEKLIGVILIHSDNSVSLRVHPYLLKEHRVKAYDVMKLFCKWFDENIQDRVNKVNITIPVIHQKVINTAERAGFKKEGVNRSSYLKDGIYYDQQNLGITRSEIQEQLS